MIQLLFKEVNNNGPTTPTFHLSNSERISAFTRFYTVPKRRMQKKHNACWLQLMTSHSQSNPSNINFDSEVSTNFSNNPPNSVHSTTELKVFSSLHATCWPATCLKSSMKECCSKVDACVCSFGLFKWA